MKLFNIRKNLFVDAFVVMAVVACATSSQANNTPSEVVMKEATYIPFKANAGQEQALAEFLAGGARLVAQTEPETLYWYALRKHDGSFGIFDFFTNVQGRDAHFAGQVAAALNQNADTLVRDGWDTGIIANIANPSVVSFKVPEPAGPRASKATYIVLNAQAGQEAALQALLVGAASVVEQTEPSTLLWAALRLDETTFAIFDTFVDEQGREAHFAGKVAAALKADADALIVGGWQNGVLNNIHNFDVIAEAAR